MNNKREICSICGFNPEGDVGIAKHAAKKGEFVEIELTENGKLYLYHKNNHNPMVLIEFK